MIFLENKYTRWYYNIINNAKNRIVPDVRERHHIIPKSLGGNNTDDNLVALTLREHFLVHRLLTKMTTGSDKIKMSWALHRMMYSDKYFVNSHTYEQSRLRFIEMLKNNPMYQTPKWLQEHSERVLKSWQNAEERRSQASISMREKWKSGILKVRSGKDNPMWGKVPSSKGKKFLGTGKSGSSNSQAKTYQICLPSGEIEQTDCLKTYCDTHGLDYHCMKKVSQGKNKQHRGYTILTKQGKESQ